MGAFGGEPQPITELSGYRRGKPRVSKKGHIALPKPRLKTLAILELDYC